MWASALGMLALALWKRAMPSSDWVDVRGLLLVPIFALAGLGLAFGVARVVVHGRDLGSLLGALALHALAIGVVWPSDGSTPPWPWLLLD